MRVKSLRGGSPASDLPQPPNTFLCHGAFTAPREADVGAILGFGYAPYSGGAVSLIDGMGLKAFVSRAKATTDYLGKLAANGAKSAQDNFAKVYNKTA